MAWGSHALNGVGGGGGGFGLLYWGLGLPCLGFRDFGFTIFRGYFIWVLRVRGSDYLGTYIGGVHNFRKHPNWRPLFWGPCFPVAP